MTVTETPATPLVGGPAYLYFGEEELLALRERAGSSQQRPFAALRAGVDANLWRRPLRGVDERFLHASSEVYFEETFSHLSNVMFTYLLTGETRYADVARSWLAELARYPTGGGSQYSVGPYIAVLAQGYRWLRAVLPADERDAIRTQLTSLVRAAYTCTVTPDRAWWYQAHLHHDFWIPVAGMGLGALALLEEEPEAHLWAARAAAELQHALDLLGADGAWHEGAADWVYGLVLFLLFADAYRLAGGPSLYDHPWLRNTWRYRLYCWLPDDTYVYLNDSFRSGRYNILGSASAHVLRKLAAEYGNGYMQWLAARDERFDAAPDHPGVYRSPYDWTTNRPYLTPTMHGLAWNFLWYDPAVAATPPDALPTAHHFANQGLVIARSGWAADSSVVTFSCGPVGGHEAHRRVLAGDGRIARGLTHAHAQATSFTLFARGQYVVVPPGYGRAASRFQNLVAVNGSGQLWGPEFEAAIEAVELSDDVDYVVGDATGTYPPEFGIRRHRRHLLFLKPHFLVIADLLDADPAVGGRVRQYTWQLHTDPQAVASSPLPDGLTLQGKGDGTRVDLRLLLPELHGRLRASFAAADDTPLLDEAGFVMNFAVPTRAAFVAVFALSDHALQTPVERVVGDRCVGALLGGAADTRAVVFARDPAETTLSYRVDPARSARHLVAGLPRDRRYRAEGVLRPRDHRWPERALRIAEEDYVAEILVEPGDEGAAAPNGLLRFEA
jgi:hypothetical protein